MASPSTLDAEMTAAHALLDGSYRSHPRADAHLAIVAPPAPPRFDALMTDIESLSLHPGQAFMLSLGIVPFRLTPEAPIMGPPLLLVFDPIEQLLGQRRIDDGTRKFWRDQPAAAQAHFRDPAYVGHGGVTPTHCGLGDIALHMAAMIADHCVAKPEVYSQGIVFDLGNIGSAMIDAGQKTPWEYWAATDCRSLRRKLPKRRQGPTLTATDGASHDPVFDSVKQIWALWEVATDDMLGIVASEAVAA